MLIQELEDINMIVLGVFLNPTSRQARGSCLETPKAVPGLHRSPCSAFRATLPQKSGSYPPLYASRRR